MQSNGHLVLFQDLIYVARSKTQTNYNLNKLIKFTPLYGNVYM